MSISTSSVAQYKESKYYLNDPAAVDGDIDPKIENIVACALLRELHFLEDTAGSTTALHFLRDKEKNEVDFLVVIDNHPAMMIEVKSGDDRFAKSLFRFHGFLKNTLPFQVVYNLKRKKSKGPATMQSVHEFLKNLQFEDSLHF